MPVYWSIFLVTILIGFFSYIVVKQRTVVEGQLIYKTRYFFALITFFYIIILVGLRDNVLDTSGYIYSFKSMPTEWDKMIAAVNASSTGKGFYFIQGLFKIFISDNHYVWFLFLASVSCFCLLRVLYKYSIDFPLTAFLFIADTTFTWLFNGTRQFLVVCILFVFSDWLIEGKKIRYILLIILLSTIHTSAIFVLPVCFFVNAKKTIGKSMVLFTIITVIGVYFSEEVLNTINQLMDGEYSEVISAGIGSNVLRLAVALVPLILVLSNFKLIEKIAPPSIILAINMSMVGAYFYLAATFTNGILIGRMPIYFTVYNLYLLPWLIKTCFVDKTSKMMHILCMILYTIFFYYQMCIAWDGLVYESNILRLHFY